MTIANVIKSCIDKRTLQMARHTNEFEVTTYECLSTWFQFHIKVMFMKLQFVKFWHSTKENVSTTI